MAEGGATSRGWQSDKSLLDCHKHMLDNQVFTDVTFVFPLSGGGSTEVKAHKYVLMCRSAVFEAMFSGNFKESSHEPDEITMTDIEPEIFMDVLRYMYHDGPMITGNNVLHVLFAAKKYLLGGLVDRCNHYLESNMSETNVCTILNHCLLYNKKELQEKCLDLVADLSRTTFDGEDFLNLNQDALHAILAYDNIILGKESDMFTSCIKWVKCRREFKGDQHLSSRDILGSCLYQIRFLSMSSADLANTIEEEPDLLTVEEQAVLLRCVALSKGGDIIKNLKFNTNQRNKCYGEPSKTQNRFRSIQKTVGPHQSIPNMIAFKVDKPIFFMGVGLFGIVSVCTNHSVGIKLYKNQHEVMLTTNEKLLCNDTDTPEPIKMTPTELTAGQNYTIEVKLSPLVFFNRYGTNGRPSVTQEGVTFTFSNSTFGNNYTTVQQGQIPQILFRNI